MRIVFDVSPLSHQRTGVGNYVRGSLAGLVAAAAGEHEIVAFAPTSVRGAGRIREALDVLPVERRLGVVPLAHAWRQLWSKVGRPPAERFVGAFDVLHFSDWMYPPQRAGVRSTMVHDVVPIRFPEWVQPRTRQMHGAKYRNAARTCDVVFVNAEFTKREVVEVLGIAAEKVRVAYPGVDPLFTQEGERADLGRPYVLTVATLEPRKNLATLLDAPLPDGHALAVVGAAGWGEQLKLDRPDVIRLGYVSDVELARLYRGASCFVYPSRFEGFGMPVVEAMACGVPVVASAHESLDEAAGAAALRAEPDDAAAFGAAIARAVADRDELVARGLVHSAPFRWEETGRVMLDAFTELAA